MTGLSPAHDFDVFLTTPAIIERNGKAIGSELIAQNFTDAKYFWPRPSAANYDGTAGAGSNLGPTNPALHDAIRDRIAALRAADPGNEAPVPADLVTASGSGLDPHISLAGATYQSVVSPRRATCQRKKCENSSNGTSKTERSGFWASRA